MGFVYWLTWVVFLLPVIGVIGCIFGQKFNYSIRLWSLHISGITLVLSCLLWGFGYNSEILLSSLINSWGLEYCVCLTGCSLGLLILSSLLIFLCVLVSWVSINFRQRDFFINLFLVEFCLFNAFCVTDLLLFYFFYEAVLIPIFLIIIIWGSRERKVLAGLQFVLYTLLGSISFVIALSFIFYYAGTFNVNVLYEIMPLIPVEDQFFIWFCLFVAFGVKVPLVPLHSWLPEAHVEAPTAGSVLLAGVLLKLGLYGLLRFLILLVPEVSYQMLPFVLTVCLFSIIYGSFVILVQIDLKKIIAYASIIHMSMGVLGLFIYEHPAVEGGIYMMLTHGIISSALFICVGFLYDRYKSRVIYYYGGLHRVMPIFSVFFFIFLLANMGLPFTAGFIAELLLFIGVGQVNFIATVLMSSTIFLGAIYSIWLYNKVMFGLSSVFIHEYCDLNRREFFILLILLVFTIIGGIYPEIFLSQVIII